MARCALLNTFAGLLWLLAASTDTHALSKLGSPDGSEVVYHGGIVETREIWVKNTVVRREMVVTDTGELIIRPGVKVYFSTGVGITVRGVIRAQGTPDRRIVFTPEKGKFSIDGRSLGGFNSSDVRLVDGHDILEGNLQLFHNQKWRDVCALHSWTELDVNVACRQLGFTTGELFEVKKQIERNSGSALQYLSPNCKGREKSLKDCNWNNRRMGYGICDLYPRFGIRCHPQLDVKESHSSRWRGVWFDNAKFYTDVKKENNVEKKKWISNSSLEYVDILFAGYNKTGAIKSALEINGVPPFIRNITVKGSAYNGVNISDCATPVDIKNSVVSENRGHGIVVNSSSGLVSVTESHVFGNGGDGIHSIHNDIRIMRGPHDFCTAPDLRESQQYPAQFVYQEKDRTIPVSCTRVFTVAPGQFITVHFLVIESSIQKAGTVVIRDGDRPYAEPIMEFSISNYSQPYSVVSTGSFLRLEINAIAATMTKVSLEVDVGPGKRYDLQVLGCKIYENSGTGLYVDNMRSMVHVDETEIYENNRGIVVHGGSGDVNVTRSEILRNFGDGINVTRNGGRLNVSLTSMKENFGYGIAVWTNNSIQHVSAHQRIVINKNVISGNGRTGVLIGKPRVECCQQPVVNVTMNEFSNCPHVALEVETELTDLFITHNKFTSNEAISVQVTPTSFLKAVVEHNQFFFNRRECLVLRYYTDISTEEKDAQIDILVQENVFKQNQGVYVVALGLPNTAANINQSLQFTYNVLESNKVTEPYQDLNPRTEVAAVLVIASTNVKVFRNYFKNMESSYEIGVHLVGRYETLNCSRNSFASTNIETIYKRIFDCKYRFHLACVQFKPYLQVESDFDTNHLSSMQESYIDEFQTSGSNEIGGRIPGREVLKPGRYVVKRDIYVEPQGLLQIMPKTQLHFENNVGMMIQGKLEIKGIAEDGGRVLLSALNTGGFVRNRTNVNLQGRDRMTDPFIHEGRLEIKLENKWGTVCEHGWSIATAAIACRQMGLTLNPSDWQMTERVQDPSRFDIIASNIRCHPLAKELSQCDYDTAADIENICTNETDVHLRCYETTWLGLRLGLLAEEGVLEHVTIERAGHFDYATGVIQAALHVDLLHHNLRHVTVENNLHAGIEIVFADNFYDNHDKLKLSQSFVRFNRGHGVVSHTPGVFLDEISVSNNTRNGLTLDPKISAFMRNELSTWVAADLKRAVVIVLSTKNHQNQFNVERGKNVYVITEKVQEDETCSIFLKANGDVFGILILNPVWNDSSEVIEMIDPDTKNNFLVLSKFETVLQAVTVFSVLEIKLKPGMQSRGGVIIQIRAVERNSEFIFFASNPQLTIRGSKFENNQNGVSVHHYNNDLDDKGNWNARLANQSIKISQTSFYHQRESALLVTSELSTDCSAVVTNNTYVIGNVMVNYTKSGITQKANDILNSTNIFNWILSNSRFEHNDGAVVNLMLPYVWDSTLFHNVLISDNVFVDNKNCELLIDGYFTKLEISDNRLLHNSNPKGLISIRGMEKEIRILRNQIEWNRVKYVIQFDITSHTMLFNNVDAYCKNNWVENNTDVNRYHHSEDLNPSDFKNISHVIGVHGVQKINVTNNILGPNFFEFLFISGMKVSSLQNFIDVRENWWGTAIVENIWSKILDFYDSNNYAEAKFVPYQKSHTMASDSLVHNTMPVKIVYGKMGGPLTVSTTLHDNGIPYVVESDLTIMPGVTLTIEAGVEMHFHPGVGMLVLGKLITKGTSSDRIMMQSSLRRTRRSFNPKSETREIRLCFDGDCSSIERGFLEMFNSTLKQWVPICDSGFTEKNGEVIFNYLNTESNFDFEAFVKFGPRYDVDQLSLSRIQSWTEPRICSGQEFAFTDCPVRLGVLPQLCTVDSHFVFLNLQRTSKHLNWGGIQFAPSNNERPTLRMRPDSASSAAAESESVLEYVTLINAGLSHKKKGAAIQSIYKTPIILNVEIVNSASHGILMVAPVNNIIIKNSKISHNRGFGINIIDFRSDTRSTLHRLPLQSIHMPYEFFGMVDMCDADKYIQINDRVLVYYKYNHLPLTCVKVFQGFRALGFRLLHFKLFQSYGAYNDFVRVFDGDIAMEEVPSMLLNFSGTVQEAQTVKSTSPFMSVQIVASGASETNGFIAEIFSLPPVRVSFDEDIVHTVSYCTIQDNVLGAIMYSSVGEISPRVEIISNLIDENGFVMVENFTSTECAVTLDLQNTRDVDFRNNVIRYNRGGLCIHSESDSKATALQGRIENNLFTENVNHPTLKVLCPPASAYQEVSVANNIFTFNNASYHEVISLQGVVSITTENFIYNNTGKTIIQATYDSSQSHVVHLQTFNLNVLLNNTARAQKYHGTMLLQSSGQSYGGNVFMNPDNDFEIITASAAEGIINATNNWWGYNYSISIAGRILDKHDEFGMLEVLYAPFLESSQALIDDGCPPGWMMIGGSCHQFVGGFLSQSEALSYCNKLNGTVSFVRSRHFDDFVTLIKRMQLRSDASVRVQTISFISSSKCSAISADGIETISCSERLPFLCEWGVDWADLEAERDMNLGILIGAAVGLAFIVICCILFLICRARYTRKAKDSYAPNTGPQKSNVERVSKGEMDYLSFAPVKESHSGDVQMVCTTFLPGRASPEDTRSLDEDKKSLSQETLPLMTKDIMKPYLETSLDDFDDIPKKKYLETSLDQLDQDSTA